MRTPDPKRARQFGAKAPEDRARGTAEGSGANEGEGNKSADKRHRGATTAFVKSGRVDEQAKKAAKALDGPERPDLEKAEQKGRDKARR